MGLQNSAQSFQRLLQEVIGDMPNVFCYLDDLLIFNKNQADHMATLEELFKKLSEAGMSIALNKCQFGQDSLNYLGYKVTAAGISPIEKKVAALVNQVNSVELAEISCIRMISNTGSSLHKDMMMYSQTLYLFHSLN